MTVRTSRLARYGRAMLRGAALRSHQNPGPKVRPVKPLAWRTPDNVRLRHDFMEQRYTAGDTLKEVAVALKEEFGTEHGRAGAGGGANVIHGPT